MKRSRVFTRTIDNPAYIMGWIESNYSDVIEKHRRVMVTIQNAPSKRSEAANNYYWGVLIEAFRKPHCNPGWSDYSKDDVHDTLGEAFRQVRKPQDVINKEIEEGRHKTEWKLKSTADMTIMEFWMYCEQCTQALIEAGGELDQEEYNKYMEAKQLHAKANR